MMREDREVWVGSASEASIQSARVHGEYQKAVIFPDDHSHWTISSYMPRSS